MKKITILFLSIILIAVFSISAFAVEEGTSSSEPSSSGSSSEESNSSSEPSSSTLPSSSEAESSSQPTTPSEPVKTNEIKLEIIELPKKTVYNVNDKLDLSGLRVNIISDEGVIASRDGYGLTPSVSVLNIEGKQRVEIRYNDVSAFFTVTVNAKHEHKYGAWSIVTEATCENDGIKSRKCECGQTENSVIAKLGHDWDEGEIVKKATTESKGEIKYTCLRCKKINIEKTSTLVNESVNEKLGKESFKLTLKWWMVFVPVGLIVVGYIVAIVIIFKKKV